MISVIEGLPDNVIGIKATGIVTHEDYLNTVIPQVERTLAAHKEFRILYEIGDDCEAFEVLALWDDTKIGLRHYGEVQRIAVVTDNPWVRGASVLFGKLMKAQVDVFPSYCLDEAKTWVSA